VVEPPAGIEPATPSLPWNHQEPLCAPPFSQVAADRWCRSYRFFSDEVMRSLSGHPVRHQGEPFQPAAAESTHTPSSIDPHAPFVQRMGVSRRGNRVVEPQATASLAASRIASTREVWSQFLTSYT
jgi:hypothetical protein